MAEDSTPKLCMNGCGFFGSPAFNDLCSVCFKNSGPSQPLNVVQEDEPDRPDRDTTPPPPNTPAEEVVPTTTTTTTARNLSNISMDEVNEALHKLRIKQDEVEGEKENTNAAAESTGVTEQPGGACATTSSPTTSTQQTKKRKSRCHVCHKKLGLLGMRCRCEGEYCELHRYSDTHNCTFNYKEHEREILRKQNPQINGSSFNRLL